MSDSLKKNQYVYLKSGTVGTVSSYSRFIAHIVLHYVNQSMCFHKSNGQPQKSIHLPILSNPFFLMTFDEKRFINNHILYPDTASLKLVDFEKQQQSKQNKYNLVPVLRQSRSGSTTKDSYLFTFPQRSKYMNNTGHLQMYSQIQSSRTNSGHIQSIHTLH